MGCISIWSFPLCIIAFQRSSMLSPYIFCAFAIEVVFVFFPFPSQSERIFVPTVSSVLFISLPTSFPPPFFPSLHSLVFCFKMSPTYQFTLVAPHSSVIGASSGEPAKMRGLKCDVAVLLPINVNGNASRVGTVHCSTVWGV